MRRGSRVLLVGLLAVLAGCSDTTTPVSESAGPSSSEERRFGVLDGVELELEVADSPEERARGLMGRTSVPPGTGMVFLYDEPSNGRFYMYRVPVPLQAVFVSEGRVVSSVVMPPCAEDEPQDCPTYGASGPYDTVVETDPGTLPDVAPGDELVLRD